MTLPDIAVAVKEISQKHQVGGCDRCGNLDAHPRDSMTSYDTSGINIEVDGDPNDPGLLCHMCYQEYVDYWQEMWDEYYSSQGCYVPKRRT